MQFRDAKFEAYCISDGLWNKVLEQPSWSSGRHSKQYKPFKLKLLPGQYFTTTKKNVENEPFAGTANPGHHAPQCVYKQAKCYMCTKCGKIGHLSKVRKSKPQGATRQQDTTRQQDATKHQETEKQHSWPVQVVQMEEEQQESSSDSSDMICALKSPSSVSH